MLRFLRRFLGLVAVSFVITVPLIYSRGIPQGIFVLLREGGRFAATIITGIVYRQQLASYRKIRHRPRRIFLWMVVFAVCISLLVFTEMTITNGMVLTRLAVGLKYGYQRILILLTATRWGYLIKPTAVKQLLHRVVRGFFWLLAIGLVRQAAKISFPEIFEQAGYGPVGNFVINAAPPVYYRTWPVAEGGVPRLQGLFSGPNNYGYILIVFFPLLILARKEKDQFSKKFVRGLGVLFALSLLLTFSRAAYLWVIAEAAAYLIRQWRISRKTLIRSSIAVVIAITAISIRKQDSTARHIAAKESSLSALVAYPMWLGLGSSGPSIHRGGSILPENYYLQIALDSSVMGLVLMVIFLRSIRVMVRQTSQQYSAIVMSIWFGGLLVAGMFLHAFEDSMANYIFFILYGVVLGSALRERVS